MKKKKILVVDDEICILEMMEEILNLQYEVKCVRSGHEAIELVKTEKPDAIVLDCFMPGLNGIETCQRLREDPANNSIAILMLTGLDDSEQRTKAFKCGADDYIPKPFSFEELLARIASKIRRSEESKPQILEKLQFEDLKLDFQELRAEVAGEPIDVGHIEFKILNILMKNHGQVVERDLLHSFVWGGETPSERALDPHITTLRRKLKKSRGELRTIYGRGYALVSKDA